MFKLGSNFKKDWQINEITYSFWQFNAGIYTPLEAYFEGFGLFLSSNHYTTYLKRFQISNKVNLIQILIYVYTIEPGSKVSFFWDPSQDMSLSGFPTKNRPLIGRAERSANQRLIFLAGNHLNSCPDSDLRKNWL